MQKQILLVMIAVMIATTGATASEFEFLGRANAAELRHAVVTKDAAGQKLLLLRPGDYGKRGYLLLVNLETGKTEQYFCPPELRQTSAFGGLLTPDGKYYFDLSGKFLMFDINTKKFTVLGSPDKGMAHLMDTALAPDGTIYFATFPKCMLTAWNPSTGKFRSYGQLDPTEKYPNLAVDRNGFVYAGIGTAHANIVALNPNSGKITQILPESLRKIGRGNVSTGVDGFVYGSFGDFRVKLLNGKIVTENVTIPPATNTTSFYYGDWKRDPRRYLCFPDGSEVRKLNFAEKTLDFKPAEGTARKIVIEFQAGGAFIPAIFQWKQKVYFFTSHPGTVVEYNPVTGKLRDFGSFPNSGNPVTHNGKLYTSEYPSGDLREFEIGADGKLQNQRILAKWHSHIHRGFGIQVAPDGKWLMVSGYPSYGRTGGGFGLHEFATGKNELITDWLFGHSCGAFRFLPSGDWIGGTSIATPGGGKQLATEAAAFRFDWVTRKLKLSVPIPGERSIVGAELWQGKLLLLGTSGQLYVLDPDTLKTFKTLNLSQFGAPPRLNSLLRSSDDRLFVLQTKNIGELAPDFSGISRNLPPAPLSMGGIIADGWLYFAGNVTDLMRWHIPENK